MNVQERYKRYTEKRYEITSLIEINTWYKEKSTSFHKKLQDIAFTPIEFVINSFGKEKFEQLEDAIYFTTKKLIESSTFTVDLQKIARKAKKYGVNIKDLNDIKICNLRLLDKCNRESINFHEKAAAIHGAAAGIGGAFVGTIDLAVVLVNDFRMIQEIAFCYGFDPNEDIEKRIILKMIEVGIGSSEIKFRALEEIEHLRKLQTAKKMNTQVIHIIATKTLESYVQSITLALLIRFMECSIPIISMAMSARSNFEFMENTGNAAFMVYRKRFIERKHSLGNGIDVCMNCHF
ncbi:MAG: EcsC family protein [Desulfobacterales bacterium]|nr:EcsC family protein [Desulfobacterales bacterium]